MRHKDFLGIESNSRSLAQAPIPYQRVGFSWSAVAAGVALAIALTIWFAEIALALNLGLLDGSSDAQTIGIANALGWVVGCLLAVFAGAWVAGRMSTARSAVGGGVHGLAVWATTSIATLLFTISAVGTLGGGMMQLVGKGLDGAGQVATLVAPDWDTVKGQLEEAKDAVTGQESSGSVPGSEDRYIDDSRLMELAGRHFNLEGSTLTAEERTEFEKLVAARLQISQGAAERTIAQWTNVWDSGVQRFEQAQTEALEVADDARAYASAAAGWAAFAMLLGAVAAGLGGAFGTACALRRSTDEPRHPGVASGTASAPMVREEPLPPPSIKPSSPTAGQPNRSSR